MVTVLPPELGSEVSAARFRREIELAARLQHPTIQGVLTAGVDGALVWHAMPYVEGLDAPRSRTIRSAQK